MPQVGFEPTISGGERPQTYASERAVTGTGSYQLLTKRKLRNEVQVLAFLLNILTCIYFTRVKVNGKEI